MEAAEDGVCYVCMDEDDPAPRSQCACRTSFLHRSCQVRMVATQEQPEVCMVCRAPYRNVVCVMRSDDGGRAGTCLFVSLWAVTTALLLTSVGCFRELASSEPVVGISAAMGFSTYVSLTLFAVCWAVRPLCAHRVSMV